MENNEKPYKSVKWPFQRIETSPVALLGFDRKDFSGEEFFEVNKRFESMVVDMQEQAIFESVVRAATLEGIDEVHLLDKKFVIDALWEKLERDYGIARIGRRDEGEQRSYQP